MLFSRFRSSVLPSFRSFPSSLSSLTGCSSSSGCHIGPGPILLMIVISSLFRISQGHFPGMPLTNNWGKVAKKQGEIALQPYLTFGLTARISKAQSVSNVIITLNKGISLFCSDRVPEQAFQALNDDKKSALKSSIGSRALAYCYLNPHRSFSLKNGM